MQIEIKSMFWHRLKKTDAGVITDTMSGHANHLEFPMGGETRDFPYHTEFTEFFRGTPAEFSEENSGEAIEIEVETLGVADPRNLVLKRRGEEAGKEEPKRKGNWFLSSQRPGPKQHPALEPGGYFLPLSPDEIRGHYFLILKDPGGKFHAWAGSRAHLQGLSEELSKAIPDGRSRAWGIRDFVDARPSVDGGQVGLNLDSAFSKETVEGMAAAILSNGPIDNKPAGNRRPASRVASASQVKRDAEVVAWVKQEADGTCELCEQEGPFTKDGRRFLEVHHVIYLSDGGHDTVENAVAVCPNCHRRCHLSDDADKATGELYDKVTRLDREARNSDFESASGS